MAAAPVPAAARRHTQADPPHHNSESEVADAARGATILVVEDDASVREMLTRLLDQEGYCPIAATQGIDALDYLATHPRPACILLDVDMPVMNGWAFRRVQQGQPALADIPVVILSALPHTATIAAQLDVPDYLHKPFAVERLRALLQRVCP